MARRDWLALVAVHSDAWLLSVAFYYGARLDSEGRAKLFKTINDGPTLFEVRYHCGTRDKLGLKALWASPCRLQPQHRTSHSPCAISKLI